MGRRIKFTMGTGPGTRYAKNAFVNAIGRPIRQASDIARLMKMSPEATVILVDAKVSDGGDSVQFTLEVEGEELEHTRDVKPLEGFSFREGV